MTPGAHLDENPSRFEPLPARTHDTGLEQAGGRTTTDPVYHPRADQHRLLIHDLNPRDLTDSEYVQDAREPGQNGQNHAGGQGAADDLALP